MASKTPKPKTVILLDNPYSLPEWSTLSPANQTNILDLLTHLLTPISRARSCIESHNRAKRRKRTSTSPTPPPLPEIANDITIGLNSTTSALEALVSLQKPATSSSASVLEAQSSSKSPLKAVFVCRFDGHPTQLHAHLPVLCQLAGDVRLIPLPKGSEDQLSTALGVARVGVLGIRSGAVDAESLLSLTETLPSVEVPWLSRRGEWVDTKVKALATKAGPRKGCGNLTPVKTPEKSKPVKRKGIDITVNGAML